MCRATMGTPGSYRYFLLVRLTPDPPLHEWRGGRENEDAQWVRRHGTSSPFPDHAGPTDLGLFGLYRLL